MTIHYIFDSEGDLGLFDFDSFASDDFLFSDDRAGHAQHRFFLLDEKFFSKSSVPAEKSVSQLRNHIELMLILPKGALSGFKIDGNISLFFSTLYILIIPI